MSKQSPKFSFPTDFYPSTMKRGTRYYGVFRLPWRAKSQFVEVDGKPYPFDTEGEAMSAATKVLCTLFRDKTIGCIFDQSNDALAEAEKLFSKEKSHD